MFTMRKSAAADDTWLIVDSHDMMHASINQAPHGFYELKMTGYTLPLFQSRQDAFDAFESIQKKIDQYVKSCIEYPHRQAA